MKINFNYLSATASCREYGDLVSFHTKSKHSKGKILEDGEDFSGFNYFDVCSPSQNEWKRK